VSVKVGDRVAGGSSVLGVLRSARPQQTSGTGQTVEALR
jgi:hypothetical protein